MSSSPSTTVGVSGSRLRDPFARIPHKALELGLDPYALATYVWIVRRAGGGRTAFESVPNMAKGLRMSARRLHTALEELEELRLVEGKRRQGRPTEYTVTDVSEWHVTPAPDAEVQQPPTTAPHAGVPDTPAPHAEVPLHHVQTTPAPGADITRTRELEQVELDKSKSMSFAESPATTPAVEIVPQAARASLTKNNPDQFLAIWNEHRGQLPAVQVLTQKRKRNLRSFLKEVPAGTDPVAVFTAAVLEVARDPFWAERKYNLDNLLRPGRVIEKAEKHAAGPAVDQKVTQAVQRASSLAERIKARREHQP